MQDNHGKTPERPRASIKEAIGGTIVSLCAPGPLAGVNRVILALVLLGAFAIGLKLAFVAPPMSALDETFHWQRVVQISEGRFLGRKLGANDWGGTIDAGAIDLAAWYMGHFERRQPIDYQQSLNVAQALSEASTQQRLASFPSTAVYSPLPYIPQAVGVFAARRLGAGLLNQFYAGRIANLTTYLALVAVAVCLMPFGAFTLLALLLFPQALHLAGSHSCDPLNIMIPVILMAWCLRLRFVQSARFDPTTREGLAALTISLGLLKPILFLISPLTLSIPHDRFAGQHARWRFVALTVGACTLIAVAWSVAYPFVPGKYWGTGADPAQSIALIRQDVAQAFWLFFTTIRDLHMVWWLDAYGHFGGHPPPFSFHTSDETGMWALYGIMALAVADASHKRDLPLAALYIAIAVVFCVAVIVAFWIGFTAPGAPTISGVQGRHLLVPFILFATAASLVALVGTRLAFVRLPLLLGTLVMHVVSIVEAIDQFGAVWR